MSSFDKFPLTRQNYIKVGGLGQTECKVELSDGNACSICIGPHDWVAFVTWMGNRDPFQPISKVFNEIRIDRPSPYLLSKEAGLIQLAINVEIRGGPNFETSLLWTEIDFERIAQQYQFITNSIYTWAYGNYTLKSTLEMNEPTISIEDIIQDLSSNIPPTPPPSPMEEEAIPKSAEGLISKSKKKKTKKTKKSEEEECVRCVNGTWHGKCSNVARVICNACKIGPGTELTHDCIVSPQSHYAEL